MKTKSRNTLLSLILVLALTTACNLPIGGSNKNNDSANSNSQNGTSLPLSPETLNAAPDQPDGKPVSFQEGIGSLDSYKMKLHILSSDSTGSMTNMDEFVESSVGDENNHSVLSSTSQSPEDTEESKSTTETYNLGLVTCTLSDGEWTYDKKTAQDKELSDIFSQMIDFVPVIKNPEFIGSENLNGIETNHFTFRVSGIGEKSGTVATTNQGDYWLAVDGEYIVSYTLDLQLQSAPESSSEAKTSILQVSYDLYDINVPVTITQPVECVPPTE
jgi:hypothetical protein